MRSSRSGPERAADAILPLAITLGVAAGMAAWLGPFDGPDSSTGAWILSQVERARLGAGYAGAACAGRVPSAYSNPLFPAAITGISEVLDAESAAVGRWLAALGLGGFAAALAGLWRRIGGSWIVGLVGALGAAWPPLVSTANLVRYDTLGMALALGAVWVACGGGARRWLLAGVMTGLAYNTREFCVAMALGGLAGVWLGEATGGRHRRRHLPRALAVAAGISALGALAGWLVLPLALGLSPFAGVAAALEISERINPGIQISLSSRLYLDQRGPLTLLILGGAGLIAGGFRTRDRAALFGLWGVMLHLPLFLSSAQQTPQYYLFGYAVALSGAAGWLRALPRWWLQAPAAIAAAAQVATWDRKFVPEMLDAQGPKQFHTEIWPADSGAIMALIDFGVEQAGDAPLVIASDYIENIDGLPWIHRGRPAAYLFLNHLGALPQLVDLYGQDLVLLTVEDAMFSGAAQAEYGELLGSKRNARLLGRAWRIAAEDAAPASFGTCWGKSMQPIRGACLQADWMAGGIPAVTRRIAEVHAAQERLLVPGRGCY